MTVNHKPHKEILPDTSFQTIFQLSPISTQIFTHDGMTIMVNKAWKKIWRTNPKDLIGRYNILHDKQLEEKGIMPIIQKAFKGEIVSIPPIKYEPDLTIQGIAKVPFLWVQAVMYPIKDTKGIITHIVLQHEDITQRLLTAKAVEVSERKFRS